MKTTFKTISEFDAKFPKTKTSKWGTTLYRVFDNDGKPIYVSIPERD